MNTPCVVLLLLINVGSTLQLLPDGPQQNAAAHSGDRIWNSHDAQPHSAPWIVALHLLAQRPPQHCGGSIIAPTWVLTAAHCVVSAMINPAGSMAVLAGRHNTALIEPSEQRRTVVPHNVYNHPAFQPRPLANDVALIRVQPGFVYNAQVRAIALPPANVVHRGWAWLHGWGMTSDRRVPAILQQVQLELLTHAECAHMVWGDALQRTQLCTGRAAGSCHGDSGGPLSQNGQLVGVVAWGTCPGGPSGYERVSLFTGWMAGVMRV